MKKIRVLQMPVTNNSGGITNYVLRNWRYIDKTRFTFDFATLGKHLDYAESLLKEDCKVYYLSCSSQENEALFVKEMSEILDTGYDAVHLHTQHWNGFLVEKMAMEHKIPVVIVHAHNAMVNIDDKDQREKAIVLHNELKEKFSADMATHFFTCASNAAEWLFGPQIPRERIRFMRNAIDVETYAFDEAIRRKYRTELRLDGCFVIGNIGRFAYQKNHEFLIDVFSRVAERMENARLMIVGDGPLRNDIERQINRLELQKKVLLLGRRDDVPKLMQAMDLFALPSRFDGLALVLVEAQTAGLPCVVSEAVPVDEPITDLVVRLPFEPELWCKEIIQTSKKYRREDYSRTIIECGYSLNKQIKVLEDIYTGGDGNA
jgi:glycosyltransferase involved in cell wall biosynthesis